MKLDAVVYGNDDDTTSYNMTQQLIQSYPNLKGIVSPTTVGIAAAARYLDTNHLSGKIQLTVFGTPNSMPQYVKDGTCSAVGLLNVRSLARFHAYATSAQ